MTAEGTVGAPTCLTIYLIFFCYKRCFIFAWFGFRLLLRAVYANAFYNHRRPKISIATTVIVESHVFYRKPLKPDLDDDGAGRNSIGQDDDPWWKRIVSNKHKR
jgi:hypothetical protein